MALPKAWSYIRSNSSIIYLGLGQSCFEGAMYAFVFVWTPALQAGGQDVGPYLGIIFSTFMVRTRVGACLFVWMVVEGGGGVRDTEGLLRRRGVTAHTYTVNPTNPTNQLQPHTGVHHDGLQPLLPPHGPQPAAHRARCGARHRHARQPDGLHHDQAGTG